MPLTVMFCPGLSVLHSAKCLAILCGSGYS